MQYWIGIQKYVWGACGERRALARVRNVVGVRAEQSPAPCRNQHRHTNNQATLPLHRECITFKALIYTRLGQFIYIKTTKLNIYSDCYILLINNHPLPYPVTWFIVTKFCYSNKYFLLRVDLVPIECIRYLPLNKFLSLNHYLYRLPATKITKLFYSFNIHCKYIISAVQ